MVSRGPGGTGVARSQSLGPRPSYTELRVSARVAVCPALPCAPSRRDRAAGPVLQGRAAVRWLLAAGRAGAHADASSGPRGGGRPRGPREPAGSARNLAEHVTRLYSELMGRAERPGPARPHGGGFPGVRAVAGSHQPVHWGQCRGQVPVESPAPQGEGAVVLGPQFQR